MKHKHAEVIKAFADGIECELWYTEEKKWIDVKYLGDFDLYYDVRIKPKPKPDVIRLVTAINGNETIKLIFDGDTGNLLGAEVIK